MTRDNDVFACLMAIIQERKRSPSDRSYTCRLLAGGVEKIGAKVEEEAAETIEAAGEDGAEGRAHLVAEAADLLYHLFVLLAHRDVALAEVQDELARRFGVSGLEEKASRDAAPKETAAERRPSGAGPKETGANE